MQEVLMRCVRILGVSFLAAVGIARVLGAQSFHGRLRLNDRTTPAPNARVWLATPQGATVDTARSNDRGEFVLTAPHGGRYHLVVRRLGYTPEHTDDFTLGDDELRRDDVILLSTRVLPTVDVSVGRETRRWFGLDPRALGSRFIRPEQVDRLRATTIDVADLLRHSALAGVSVIGVEFGERCVQTRTLLGCAAVYLDGMYLGNTLPPLSSDEVESLVVVRPLDSVLVGGNGAVMIFTGRG
jgi:hypothetical protein